MLRFADDDAAALAAGDLANRYLWGPIVDQLLAEENVTSLGSAGTVDWPLTDHLGTIRDWARYSSGSTTILDHAEIDAFGNRLDAPTVDSIFGWTGRYRDVDTGLQWNGAENRPGGNDETGRWYDSGTGRWLSEDASGLAPDRNPFRYVGNNPLIFIDPTGQAAWVIIIPILPLLPFLSGCNKPQQPWTNDPNNNCYNYACDRRFPGNLPPGDPIAGQIPKFWNPGESDPTLPPLASDPAKLVTCKEVMDRVKKERAAVAPTNGKCPPGFHKIRVWVDPGKDFHFYREDPDGTWSDKRGNTDCRKKLPDPNKYNNYQNCGDLCVPD